MKTLSSSIKKDSPPICPKTGKVLESRSSSRFHWFLLLYTLSGLSALAWFLVRVIPKPSRAAYPCQRLAMPVASSFVLWLLGFAGSVYAFRKAGMHLRRARYFIAGLCAAGGIGAACWTLSLPGEPALGAWTPSEPPNTPMGVAKGIHPGRVVWVHDPDATSWDGSSSYWWTSTYTNQAVVDDMMSMGIRKLSGESDDLAAWDALFRHFNRTHGRGDVGYRDGEGIAIKINMNVAGSYSLNNEPIASPQAVHALLSQLVRQGGVKESAITVYDASRCITDAIVTPCHGEFPGVNFVDKEGAGNRLAATVDTTTAVHFADSRVGSSGSTRFPQCVVNATYLINMALFRGHSMAGVTLCAKNHFGSVWRPSTWSPSHIHPTVDKNNAVDSENSLVDLMGHKHLDGKAFLFLIDGLYGAVHQSSSTPARWRSSPFNNDWTSSLFLSQDGVAIDSVAVDFCRNEPMLDGTVRGSSVDNYLHEAALADDPPSGSLYDPEGDGTRLASLGVHEHWNNPDEKQYSRNLGTGDGIELILVSQEGGFRRADPNSDGTTDLSDAIAMLFHLFLDRDLTCASSADADDSGIVDLSDTIYLLSFLFKGGEAPPEPFDYCGEDPTGDDLGCDYFLPCSGGSITLMGLASSKTAARILIPEDGSLGLTWTEVDFDDGEWIEGDAAVGYDRNDTYIPHISTDVGAVMDTINTSAYIRIPFNLDRPLPDGTLTFWIKYDDGFIAYLNGNKVAERNAPLSPQWNSVSEGQHGDDLAVVFEEIDISVHAGLIEEGKNVLAVHGLNTGSTSSDFLIVVELEVRTP